MPEKSCAGEIVLMAGMMPPTVEAMIAERAVPIILPAFGPGADEVIESHGSTIRAMVLGQSADPTFLSRFPKLGLIANMGVGYDGVPVDWCARNGILVSNTPHVLSDDVADTAIALTLMTLRQLGQAERFLRAGKWADGAYPLTDSMSGKRVGILGFGRIGQAVARRLQGFDVMVAYFDPVAQPDSPLTRFDSALSLAENSDVLICVLPGGPGTRGLVDAGILSALGADGVVINIGRGTAIDQNALIEALETKTIASAGLDVYETEPVLPARLTVLDHVVLLPHIASGSHGTREKMARLVADNVFSFLETGRAVTPVPETPNPTEKEN